MDIWPARMGIYTIYTWNIRYLHIIMGISWEYHRNNGNITGIYVQKLGCLPSLSKGDPCHDPCWMAVDHIETIPSFDLGTDRQTDRHEIHSSQCMYIYIYIYVYIYIYIDVCIYIYTHILWSFNMRNGWMSSLYCEIFILLDHYLLCKVQRNTANPTIRWNSWICGSYDKMNIIGKVGEHLPWIS